MKLPEYVRVDNMKAVNMWKRILSMPDSRSKMVKVWKFAGHYCVPYGQMWTYAMDEFNRLYNLGYWKWQDKSKQNG